MEGEANGDTAVKYGAHAFVWLERWSDASLGIIPRAKALGLDALEISNGDDVVFTPSLMRRAAEDAGMMLVLSPGGAWPMECDISADDPGEQRKGLEWHRRAMSLAAEIGAVAYAGAIYGHPGRVLRRRPPPEEYARAAENLHALADYGARLGVKLVLEPMSHFRTHMVNTPEQLMTLIRLADHANIGALLDTYHLVTEVRDYGAAVRTVASRLWGIHACESDRGVPGGGLVPWRSLFDALKDVRFDGCISMESYNSSLGDFACRRGMFHNVCPNGDEFVRRGLAFLRKCAG